MAQTLGLISAIWKGTKVKVERGQSRVSLGGLVQEEVVTDQQVDYSNQYKASRIEITTVVTRGSSILALFSPGQGELQVQCDTGQTLVWPDAFIRDEPKFGDGAGGKLRVQWSAGAPTEVLNG